MTTTKLGLSVDEVLATTRAVRKRLDVKGPVRRSPKRFVNAAPFGYTKIFNKTRFPHLMKQNLIVLD